MRFLLDTNTLSEATRKSPEQKILQALDQYRGQVGTSAPVWHELLYGASRLPHAPTRRRIERFLFEVVLPEIPILAYDSAAAEWHAEERARLATRGIIPPFVDGQIAAIAAVNDLVLVTSNLRDFRPFKGLRVVDWRR